MSLANTPRTMNKLDYLRLMMSCREGDKREAILLRQSKGWFHVGGTGHEALGMLAFGLGKNDFLYPYYRDRAIMLARGLTNYELALAYFAKRESSSGGRQRPGHYSSREHNIVSVCTPTGGGLIPAAGTAWAMKLADKGEVTLATVGDAAMRQGEFYEAWAFAVQEKLPLVLVIEDNKYGISTPTEKFMALNLRGVLSEDLVVKTDARYVENVRKVAEDAYAKARAGEGPTLVWADLDRLSSHTSSDDHRVYRDQADIDAMFERDPIKLLADELIAKGELTQAAYEKLGEEIALEVRDEYDRAEQAEDPRSSELFLHCWGEERKAEKPPLEPGSVTMVDAINKTFNKALEEDPNVIFFGEDIEDPKGGVFGMTKGLSETFPKQVFNSPLAEATIVGVGVGMCAYGMKPVFELQFVDFICPAWNQIVTNLSTTRWRSFGGWSTSMVVYAPYGAYFGGGSLWHSQSNESWLCSLPGIKVAVPSTPEDAAGLFWTAIQSDDPCFVLVPKHVFRVRRDVEKVEPLPFGKAKVVREGSDVTVVGWGNTVHLAEQAAEKLQGEVSLEVVDLRSLVPCDYETVVESLRKTGRLVVVQEDTRTCGFGQAVVSEITDRQEWFSLLWSAPRLLSRPDVHIGFHPAYEFEALVSVDELVEACRAAMD
ncbi:MAG: 2-oxoisovalerate dehydrogenase [Fimbriimonadaceae bacterium]|nr:2-oxoisovalerate dehydrogenase [Fimbriimonadaceae bacterium]